MVYKTIPLTESQVGKYVDINGDGIPEGVIFADLAIGGKCEYGNNADYVIPTIKEGIKDYVIIDKYDDKINGKQEVLSPILDGNDRFYVMALNDLGFKKYTWYDWANYDKIDSFESATKQDFGTGRQNTLNMIDKWNNSIYGEKNINDDLWSAIQNEVKDGWFVPSRAEWTAFEMNFQINTSNYLNKGLSGRYWSSSLNNYKRAYVAQFWFGCMTHDFIYSTCSLRLVKTI